VTSARTRNSSVSFARKRRPRMVSVQAAGCAPIVKAFEEGKRAAELWQNGNTVASGLRVPQAVADFLILQILRESDGTAVSVRDEAMLAEIPYVGKSEGIFFCPKAPYVWRHSVGS
jgi:threonine synthase